MAQEIVFNTQKRIEWIDQLRGLLFLFVIICHSRLAPPFLKHLYEPIFLTCFFFLSGYLYKDKDIATKMKSIFNGLVAPFLLYSLLLGGISLLQTFDPCVVMDTTVVNLLGGDTIWFIPCLILVEVLYVLISKFLKSKSNAVCIILAVVALFVTSHIHIDFNVWCWQTALFALGFYAYGHILKERLLNRRNTAIGVCTYIALCIIAGNLGWLDGIDMHKHRYGVPIVFLFLSTIGCVVCVSLIRFLPSAKLLVEFGRYTLFMFPFHSVILRHVLKVLYKLSKIPDMLLLLLAVTITSAICLFAARYIYRYVPALGGKKKWIK